MKDLLNAIVEKINVDFKDHTKYLLSIGEGFERPSFFIYGISNNQTDVNRSIYNQNIIIQIVYFDKLDKYQNHNKLKQIEVGEKLLKLFACISLKTANRSIRITNTFMDFNSDDELYIQLTFDKNKLRLEDLTGYEMAETIELNIEGGM